MQRMEGIVVQAAPACETSMIKEVARVHSKRPKDGILDFSKFDHTARVEKTAVLYFERVTRFEALPIEGWHDRIGIEDSQCKQSCVRDCNCVHHCSWVLA